MRRNVLRCISLIVFSIALFFFSTGVYAENLDLSIEDVKIIKKNSNVTISDLEFSNNTVTSNINFSNKNDYVTFEVELKNNTDENYKIVGITDNNELSNVEITYDFNENINKGETNKFKVKILYKEKLTNTESVTLNDLIITLNLMDESGAEQDFRINAPNTGDNIFHYLVLLIISITGIYFIKNKKTIKVKNKKIKLGNFILLIALVALPFCCFAIEKYMINLKIKGIILESEYLDYAVNFNTNGGNSIDSREVTYGQAIGDLPDGEKEGYTFNGWKDQEGNTVTSNTIVTGELNLSADFTAIKYDITYNLNHGSVNGTNKSKYTIEDEFDLINPTRKGYTFAGWTEGNSADLYTRVTISHETGDKSYTAHWSKNQNTKYYVNHKYPNLDGSYVTEREELTGPTDEEVTAPFKPKTGFDNPTNTQNLTISADEDSEVTYTYKRHEYELTINEDVETTFTNSTYPYETEITLTAKDKDNYEFIKWSNGETTKTITFNITDDINIYPIYEVTGFTVTYNANGGNFYDTNVTTNQVTYLPNNEIVDGTYKTPTKTDNAFKGWYTNRECTEGNEFNASNYEFTENIEVYAKWQEGTATFIAGTNFVRKFSFYSNNNATSFGRSTTIPEQYLTNEYVVSTSDSDIPIYMWYDAESNKIKWYSDVTKAYANSNSSNMFSAMSGNTSKITTYDLNGIDTSHTTNMSAMFAGCRNIKNIDLSTFDTSNVTNMKAMFEGAEHLETLNLGNFDTSKVTDMSYMFYDTGSLKELNISNFNTNKVTNMKYMFAFIKINSNYDVTDSALEKIVLPNNFGSAATDMSYMFVNLKKLEDINFENANLTNTKDVSYMFSECNSLESINLNGFSNNKIETFTSLFAGCSSLNNLDLSNFDTSSAKTLTNMFARCSSLTTLDLSNFDTSNVTSMYGLFFDCSNLNSIDLSSFNTSNVTSMTAMFTGCSSLEELDLSSFDTSKLVSTDMDNNNRGMFENCTNLRKIVASDNFVTTAITNSTKMFKNCTSLVGGRGTVYDTNHIDKAYAHIDGGVDNPGYFTSNITYTVTFNANGGTTDTESINVNVGEAIGTLPIPTPPTGKVFDAWYTEIDGGTKITAPYTPEDSTTLYAHWKNESFSVVFSEPGECTFNGANGVLTGDNCSYANGTNKYIDTGINLYNEENHDKDYEIGFTIVSYNSDEQVKQATFMNTKLEGNKFPGLVFRRKNSENIMDLSSRRTSSENSQLLFGNKDIKNVKIYRIYNPEKKVQEIYYSINGGEKVLVNNLSSFNPIFDLSVWFGAAPTDTSATTAQRILVGTMKDMYIKLGTYQEDNTEKYTITYNANGGSVTPTSKEINVGDAIGTLPTPTAPVGKEFEGWYTGLTDGTKIETTYKPNNDITIYAKYIDKTFNVTFNTDGGSNISSQTIIYGNKVTKPSDPTKTGYTFNNWYTDDTYTTIFDFDNTLVTSEITIYAKFNITKYTVTFETDGGTEIAPLTVNYGEKISKPENDPTKDGLVFENWYTSDSYSSIFNFNSTTIKSDTTIYAKFTTQFALDSWTTIANNVRNYNTDAYHIGDTKTISLGSMGQYDVRIANMSTPEECLKSNFSRTACGFVIEFVHALGSSRSMYSAGTSLSEGWKECRVREYLSSTVYENLPSDLKNIIYDTYAISGSYKANGARNSETYDKLYLLSSHEIYEDLDGVPNQGIDEWDSSYNNTRQLDYYKSLNVTNSQNKILAAKTLKNGVEVMMWLRSAAYLNSDYWTYVTKTGLTSWDTASNTRYFSPAFRISDTYNLTFNTNGGTSVDNIVVEKDYNIGKLPITTREGYGFEGWYEDEEFTKQISPDTIPKKSTTYYAKWVNNCNGFGEDSWSTIKTNLDNDYKYYPVGCEKKVAIDMNNDGEDESYTVRLVNRSTPEECFSEGFSQTACGPVIEFVDIVSMKRMKASNSTSGGWKSTELVTWLNNDFYNKLPTDLKSIIIPTYPIVSGSGENYESPDILEEDSTKNKVYLLTAKEVGQAGHDNKANYCRETDYYNVYYKNEFRIKKYNDEIVEWWLRAARNDYDKWFLTINESGYNDVHSSSNEAGVAPAFRIGTEKYTVTLNANGGEVTPKYILKNKNETVGELPIPTPPIDKVFEGWYTGLTDGVKVTNSYTPNSNVILYARYVDEIYTVSFDTNNGTSISSQTIAEGNKATRPSTDPTKAGMAFVDWYTDNTYTTVFDFENTEITNDTTVYAKWRNKLVSANNIGTTELSQNNCSNNVNININDDIVCKRAIKLHNETCPSGSRSGYCNGKYGNSKDTKITYGNCGTRGTLNDGDAFTCDVNGDGIFDEESERFYYLGKYYDPDTNSYNSDVGVLIYYNNVVDGLADNSTAKSYNSNGRNNYGPVDIATNLPTISQWSNVSLVKSNRQILNEKIYMIYGERKKLASNSNLPIFNYNEYAARFVTIDEMVTACGIMDSSTGELDDCNYVFENTEYANPNLLFAIWTETPYSNNSTDVWTIFPYDRDIYKVPAQNATQIGARPVIEVPISKINY